MKKILAAIALVLATVGVAAQNYEPSPDLEALHVPFDALLDLHVRDGLVYYRALQGDRGRLNRTSPSLERAVGRVGLSEVERRPEEGVLAERLQRARAADRRQPLSDSGRGEGLSGEQHQADSRRVRKDAARDRRKAGDAGSDREHGARRVQRPARVSCARARGRRQRAPSQRSVQREGRRQAARSDRRRSSPSRRDGSRSNRSTAR